MARVIDKAPQKALPKALFRASKKVNKCAEKIKDDFFEDTDQTKLFEHEWYSKKFKTLRRLISSFIRKYKSRYGTEPPSEFLEGGYEVQKLEFDFNKLFEYKTREDCHKMVSATVEGVRGELHAHLTAVLTPEKVMMMKQQPIHMVHDHTEQEWRKIIEPFVKEKCREHFPTLNLDEGKTPRIFKNRIIEQGACCFKEKSYAGGMIGIDALTDKMIELLTTFVGDRYYAVYNNANIRALSFRRNHSS